MEDRIILHVDMDAFYASVEAMHRPELAEVPVVIGADPQGGRGRGVVSTANYHARRYGIHSAMAISKAYEACPEAVFLAPDARKYRPASQEVMEVLRDYADVLEVVGMDEAYLDVSHALGEDWNRVPGYCRSLQAAVKRATGLSCSVGAAPTKSIAKVASDYRKPHGTTVVTSTQVAAFIDPLPLHLINGCGPKMTQALKENGYRTVGDIVRADPDYLRGRFGKNGAWIWAVANGHEPRPVRADRGPSKSRGNERTYRRDERSSQVVMESSRQLLEGLLDSSKDRRAFATITVKLRYHDFTTLTRAHTLSIPLDPSAQETHELAWATTKSLLTPLLDGRPIRLVGVRLSGFTDAPGQRCLDGFLAQDKSAVPKWTEKSSHHSTRLATVSGSRSDGNGTVKVPRNVARPSPSPSGTKTLVASFM